MRIPVDRIDEWVHFVALSGGSPVPSLDTFIVYGEKAGTVVQLGGTADPEVQEVDGTNMPGLYRLQVDEPSLVSLPAGKDTEELALHISHGSMDAVTRTVEIYRPEVTEGETVSVVSGIVAAVGSVVEITVNTSGEVAAEVTSISSGICNWIADHFWRRHFANAKATVGPDAKTFRSGLGMQAKLVNKVAPNGAVLEIMEDDDATVLGQQNITSDPNAEPITSLDTV